MEKIKENFKKYSTVYIVILLLLVIIGVSYAIFAVTNLSDVNTINLGQISMSYTEPDNALVLENALPMGDAEGIAQSNYFEFKVMTHATTDADDSNGLTIPYEINLGEIEVDADKQALTKDQIKVYLTKVVGGSEEEVVGPILLSNLSESSTSNLNIYQARDVHRNAGSEITTTYRLRAWIDEDVDSSIFGSQVYQYKFRVNINSLVEPISDTLANNWKDYTEEENEFIAIYTLDSKELPETKEYNSVVYTKSKEVDISAKQTGSVLLGTYQDADGNKIAIICQDGGVIAPEDSSFLFSLGYKNIIKLLDLSNLDTSKVTDMSSMFTSCSGLTELNLSNFDTSMVIDMSFMFQNCSGLTELNLSSFNTSKVTDMSYMFTGCGDLAELNLSNFDTSKVTDMNRMFFYCESLTELDLSNFNTSKVTDMNYMFYNCRGLTELNLSSFNTSMVTGMNYMFYNCRGLTELNLSSFNTSKVTDMRNMFYGCSSLTELNLSNFDTSNVTAMGNMFSGCSSLTELNLSSFNTSKVTDMRSIFSGCSSLTELDLSNFDTSKVTNMNRMFTDCNSLTELDLSNFDTSKVTNMSYMFNDCSGLTKITVGCNWTTENADTSNMFRNAGVSEVTMVC